ncbi:mRNA interferase, toxin HicA [Pseudomonas syringae pv. persicae]|uniref:mRNA interferase, toxin HicA n=1 Tax=Pseudomonas syringae pv. persicae TaxID=237306 RepID=A0AB38EME9_9PSED|nr:mRNA interferase, toxin HicA [Pseudomonas syringae pv. persicae]SOQ16510.1 mRNA interferase, toxin HicA [Pseudomonas syringae pv. persicae]
MKCSEFRRWLQAQGAEFKAAKGSHFKVYLMHRNFKMPMHQADAMTEASCLQSDA